MYNFFINQGQLCLIKNKKKSNKFFNIMRISVLLLLSGIFTISATVYSQDAKISIQLQENTVNDVFTAIKNQTDYSFWYDVKDVDVTQQVSLSAENETVKSVLSQALQDQDVDFTMYGNHIIIAKKGTFDMLELQQGITITGKVIDSDNQPLPGVTVKIKESSMGTTTDIDGLYTLQVPNENTTLVFSYIGYVTQELSVGNRRTIHVTLSESTHEIDEVVVIGYGTMRKKDLTGAITAIGGDKIADRKATQISTALQGAMSGVLVTRNNNAPGATATIRVRGITTIGDSNPLIIVDGMQVDDINHFNPNDIENITVLKDAASASIYGSQAAAGVILITTKRAKADQFNLEYNFEYGLEIPTQNPQFVDVIRYMQMTNETRWNDAGNGTNEYPTYAKDLIDNYWQLNRDNPNKYPNTNWYDLMMKSHAPRETHMVRITGGSKSIRTAASFAYDKIGDLYTVGDRSYERLTSKINNDLIINKFLAATLDINFRRTIDKQPYFSPVYYTRYSPPVYAALWDDGRLAEGKTGDNIYGETRDGGFKYNWYNQLGAKLGLDFTPLDGLKISGIFSPVFNFNKRKEWQKAVHTYLADDPTVRGPDLVNSTNLNEDRSDNYRLTTQFIANYSKSFGQHSMDLMAGYENRYEFNERLGAYRGNYDLDTYPYLNVGPLELRNNSGTAWEYARRSFFGRAMYSFANKYLLQANIRYDASSRFASGYRWGAFPSVSAGWVISEEKFMLDIPALSFLKLRVSWGSLGNERIGNYNDDNIRFSYYPYVAILNFDNALLFRGSSVSSENSAAQYQYAIRNITWETTENLDIGIDANFFNNRLHFTGDYYKKQTRDMLLALQIPTYMGFDNPNQNTGKMNTTGWELNLGWQDKIGELGYSIDFNISDFKSVMGDLGGTEFLGDKIKIEGSEFDEWYGYRSLGLFQTQDEVTGAAILANTKAGDVRYKDISGVDGTPDNRISPEYDRVLLGGSLPRYTYGGNIRLDYKDIDFGLVIQGVGKQNSRIIQKMVEPLAQNWLNFPAIVDGHVYSHYNTAEQNLAAKYPRLSYSNAGNNYAMSDFWMFNGRYFRLKNITIGYTLPRQWVNKAMIQNLRIYASATDLFCLNKFPKGWDPEVEQHDSYPITTSVVFGLSVKF